MGIGYAGGLGVVALTLGLGLNPGQIPWDVILIIMSVIGAISAMQLAGGLDYLVKIAEKILRRNPKHEKSAYSILKLSRTHVIFKLYEKYINFFPNFFIDYWL